MAKDLAGIERNAELSDCGRFRFSLRRSWGAGPVAAWLMLNPSTADAELDDPTLRRCMDFSAQWGMTGVVVVNVFPFRSPDPKVLWAWLNAIDDEPDAAAIATNLRRIHAASNEAALRVVGFGAEAPQRAPEHLTRALEAFGAGAMCLGTNANGWPLHPMARGKSRVPSYAKPTIWTWPNENNDEA